MFQMNWEITIGGERIKMLESVKISSSLKLLADTAKIVIPGAIYGKSLDLQKKFTVGSEVIIKLGYNGNLHTEFEGYLLSVTNKKGSLTLECEDKIYLFRKTQIPDEELLDITLEALIEKVVSLVAKENPEIVFNKPNTFNARFDKFNIKGNSAYDILKKIQKELNPNIFIKDNNLFLHYIYSESFGTETNYDFSKNIEKEDLTYKTTDERKILVEVEYKDEKGEVQKETVGAENGEKVTRKIYLTDKETAQSVAKQELDNRVYDGFEGSFTAWLEPFCAAGYLVSLKDSSKALDDFKEGTYYVLAVDTDFSKSGAVRKITVGKKYEKKELSV